MRGLDALDNDLGSGPQGWTYRHPAAQQFFLFVEVAFSTVPMTIYTVVTAALLVWRKHVRAAVWTVGVMLAAALTTYFLKGCPAAQAAGVAGPGHHADQLLLPLRARHRDRRRGGGGRSCWPACSYGAGACAARSDLVAARRSRCWSGWTGSSSGVHNPSDVRRRRTRSARSGCWSGSSSTTRRRAPSRARRSAPRCRPPGSSPWSSTRSRSRTSTRSGRWSSAAAADAGWDAPTWYDHHGRGPGPLDGRAGRDLRRGAGDRLRRRRHGPHGVRRARRHRRLGRRRPGRHRQPAGPQPRHPAVPAGRRRRRAQRPGPGHRPGQGLRRRHRRGRALHGDGRDGLRRRDHGGRQRADQGQGRLAGLRRRRRCAT